MNTNIEPGCLCMVINDPDINGVCVTAVSAHTEIFAEGSFFRSAHGTLTWVVEGLPEDYVPFIPEDCLRRIDGHTEDKQTETVKEKVDG